MECLQLVFLNLLECQAEKVPQNKGSVSGLGTGPQGLGRVA